MSHLLPLSALHAAAPGVLDVIFGADGDFEGAPPFRGPVIVGSRYDLIFDTKIHGIGEFQCLLLGGTNDCGFYALHRIALDCRIPSVAARLLRLCGHASDTVETVNETEDLVGHLGAHMINIAPWHVEHAVRVAALTLALAPKIAALGGARG